MCQPSSKTNPFVLGTGWHTVGLWAPIWMSCSVYSQNVLYLVQSLLKHTHTNTTYRLITILSYLYLIFHKRHRENILNPGYDTWYAGFREFFLYWWQETLWCFWERTQTMSCVSDCLTPLPCRLCPHECVRKFHILTDSSWCQSWCTLTRV